MVMMRPYILPILYMLNCMLTTARNFSSVFQLARLFNVSEVRSTALATLHRNTCLECQRTSPVPPTKSPVFFSSSCSCSPFFFFSSFLFLFLFLFLFFLFFLFLFLFLFFFLFFFFFFFFFDSILNAHCSL